MRSTYLCSAAGALFYKEKCPFCSFLGRHKAVEYDCDSGKENQKSQN